MYKSIHYGVRVYSIRSSRVRGRIVEKSVDQHTSTEASSSTAPIYVYYDSQVAICVAKNNIYNEKRRHIQVKHEFVRHLIMNGVITMEYVRLERNIANPLTK